MPYDDKRKPIVNEDAFKVGQAFDLSIEPDHKPKSTEKSDNTTARLVMCVPQSQPLTEGGARGRPAAKDYERRPAVVNKPFTMHRAMSEDEESGSGSGSGSWSGSGSGYEDSDFENTLNFSDDSHSQNSHDIAVADFNQNEFATATSVVFPEGGAVNNNSNTSFK